MHEKIVAWVKFHLLKSSSPCTAQYVDDSGKIQRCVRHHNHFGAHNDYKQGWDSQCEVLDIPLQQPSQPLDYYLRKGKQ